MENHEDNLQQEIIDSLSRKYTELEKRQSKLEASNLEAMPNQIKELEKTVAEIKIMNTTEINDQLKQYGNQLDIYGQQLKSFPKEVPIRNKIEFDTKSRFVVRIILSLIGFAAVSIGVVVVLVFELSSRSDYKDKYKIVQGFYPRVADQVDSAYLVNKDTLLNQAEINIEHRKELLDAELDAKQAKEKNEDAKQRLEKLKKHKLK
ncbi:hypothetical protein [Mucilaginibacter sp. L3T2-6]|uniref:hypothetical protein n=1 Tax=Mucilaginibacter sp. L3T2-6 TaxID=3062491 RepID=UPI002674EBC9|nr:hypothetical protein [Mucilaginibacter sp. L3T2-6]MDO3645294.1 hypothetical protein [Mucilaginibacter sp. L3T2-6]MDV6217805.1 hypothetical protein [Mucilaginibacter sp. L3T2-6]